MSREILLDPFSELEKGKGIRLAEFLASMKVDVLFSKEVFEGKGTAYVFADAGIGIRKTDEQKLNRLMEHNPAKIHTMEVPYEFRSIMSVVETGYSAFSNRSFRVQRRGRTGSHKSGG